MGYVINIMKNIIIVYDKKIVINTNSEIIYKSINCNFEKYETRTNNIKRTSLIFNIIIDQDLYNDKKINYLCSIKYAKNGNQYLIHKQKLIIINKKRKQVSIIIKKLDNNVLDDINRTITNFLFNILENDKILFIEGSCISINNNAVILLGDVQIRKDFIYNVLKTNYNYVCLESVGIRYNNDGDIQVINLPEKTKMQKTYEEKIVINPKLRRILILEEDTISKNVEKVQVNRKEFNRVINLKHYNQDKKYISYIKRLYRKDDEYMDYNSIYNSVEIIKVLYNKLNFNDTYQLIKKNLI